MSEQDFRPRAPKAITSLANPLVKEVRGLTLAKNRKASGLFIAEGLKLVTDGLEKGWTLRMLIYAAQAENQPGVARVAKAAGARGADVLSVSEAVLEKIARRDNPQTVIGVFRQQTMPAAAVKPGERALWVGLENIRDPGNLGTILRTIDGIGADGAILIGETVDPFSIEAVRATMGSIFHVPIVRLSAGAFPGWRRSWPGVVVGAHLQGSVDYRRADYRRPLLLLMGNEQAGLTEASASLCDSLVRIPMAGGADSLNLAVATAVMLFEIKRDELGTEGRG
ncbi:MAG: RNA methyltransferase [Bauldia sp.]|nr:RNA methyltransferase [Bauldia sp.]